MPAFSKSLFGQVVVALVLGIVVGVFWPDFAAQMKPLGDGFIRLIKMMIAPLVFGVVVHGIAGAGDLKKVGRVGVKSIIYFEVVTTIALVLGILVAYVFGPGHGMNVDPPRSTPARMAPTPSVRSRSRARSASCCTSSRRPWSAPSPTATSCRCW